MVAERLNSSHKLLDLREKGVYSSYTSGRTDSGFVAAVAGSVAFFLSIREQVKRRDQTREIERAQRESETLED